MHKFSSFIDYRSWESKPNTYYICIHRDGNWQFRFNSIRFKWFLFHSFHSLQSTCHILFSRSLYLSHSQSTMPTVVCVPVHVYWNTSEFRSCVAAVFKTKNTESINMSVEICWNVCSSDFFVVFFLVLWCRVYVWLYCYVCVMGYVHDELRRIQYMLHSSLATAVSRFGPQMHMHVCVWERHSLRCLEEGPQERLCMCMRVCVFVIFVS